MEDSSKRGERSYGCDSRIGRYVGRGLGSVILLGKVVSFDESTKIFTVSYENGDSEDLAGAEIGKILVTDERADGRSLLPRKRNLDRQIASEDCKRRIISENPGILELPPSSEEFAGIPEDFIPFLFTLYGFLSTFGVELMLSPFSLKDFVGCLDCRARNSLLDAVHLSLMRALSRHLWATLSSDTECLRLCEWSLLDALTWPAILVRYLYIMGHMKWLVEKGFTFCVSSDEYYILPVASKLEVLRILYEVLVESTDFMKELDISEHLQEENKSKASPGCGVLEMDVARSDSHHVGGRSNKCWLCGMSSVLILCNRCLFSYRSRCMGVNRVLLQEERCFCLECTVDKLGETSARKCREMGKVIFFGTDANSRVFLGTCNHLLAVGKSFNLEAFCRYYNHDDARKVLNAMCLTPESALVYADICRGISTYLDVPLVTMQFVKHEPVRHSLVDKETVVAYISSSAILPSRSTIVINEAGTDKCLTHLSDGKFDNIESHLAIIAEQLVHMQESLQGLISGPLSDVEYKQQWHKLVREASSCRVLKFLLLELERSIRVITFSTEWSELVDDWLFSSAMGGHGGITREQSVIFESKLDYSGDKSKALKWWRGRKFSKVIFQKGVLHSSMARKAGRQGGLKGISGVHYPEVSDLPRRSRQLAWRASVDTSMNASELALQVRCLVSHVRWRDLVRPEPNSPGDKRSDVDAVAFQHALICDKRIVVNEISYAVSFASQKYPSLCVTKNILERETTQNMNEKLWFSENHVPLYLIKEYEEKVGTKPHLDMLRSISLPKLKRKELKSRGDIFSYLIQRRDTVRCHNCRVYCQKDHTVTSSALKDGDFELFTCTKCYNLKLASLLGSSKQTVNANLTFQGLKQQQQQDLLVQNEKQSQQVCKVEVQLDYSAFGSKYECKASHGGRCVTYGLIWKQQDSDSGRDFRLNNVILKRMEGLRSSRNITCCLCKKPYRSDLTYVRCEICSNWYHALALELKEAQYFDLVGFKCCKCRKRCLPRCPYED